MSHTNSHIFLQLSIWYFNNITLREGETKQGNTNLLAFLTAFQAQYQKAKERYPKQIKHSFNGFYLRFIKENPQSHKPRCSWKNLMLLCPKLIFYFISKWDIRKSFTKVLHSYFMKENKQFYKARYSCWKTWYWISVFLMATGFQSWVTKIGISQSFPVKFCGRNQSDLQALVKVQSCHTWCCLRDIIQCIPNSSNKDIAIPKPLQSIFIAKASSLRYLRVNKMTLALVFNVTTQWNSLIKVILKSCFHPIKSKRDVLEPKASKLQLRKM